MESNSSENKQSINALSFSALTGTNSVYRHTFYCTVSVGREDPGFRTYFFQDWAKSFGFLLKQHALRSHILK